MPKKPEGNEEGNDRKVANLALISVFLVIVGAGVWLIFALDNARRAEDCLAQGRHNCGPIQAPAR